MERSESLQRDGFVIIRTVLTREACDSLAIEIAAVMDARPSDAIGAGQGRVVGGRNLLSVWDGWRQIVQRPAVSQLVANVLGRHAGVVRILYFDKPPGKGWSLSLHRDRTIAVAKHCDPPTPFSKPTKKAGVPHVEASDEVLRQMLTLRLHLDPMHNDNGPLMVVPGSHASHDPADTQTIRCGAGDLFVMRPLLSHGSKAADPNTTDHRRVVHLELAANKHLPANYQWHQFEAVG
ncbi:MAG: phytanoyl-CoA dioxygenase [Pirellulaceae bacterium]|nr:phytanoyl-CoA dioxygenase [Pirellulaceae bacterium]